MGQLLMTDHMPDDIDVALARLEAMHCYLTIKERKNGSWSVFEGVCAVFVADTIGEAEAFVIGRAWTLEALEPQIKEVVRKALAP